MSFSKSLGSKLLAFFILFFSTPFFLLAEVERPKQKWIVGTTSGYAPYVSLNDHGEYEGFDIDFARLLAEKLDRELVIKDLGGMTSLLVALQKKKIDAIVWAMSITESRQKEMEMIYYQGEKVTDMPFLFGKEIPQGVQSIDDLTKLPGSTICVEAGSYQDSVLQNYPSLKTRFLDKITDAIMEVKYGKALAATLDNSLVPRVKEQYPDLKILHLPLPESQQTLGNGVCLHKESRELAQQIAQAIEELREEGKIAELEKKWKLVE